MAISAVEWLASEGIIFELLGGFREYLLDRFREFLQDSISGRCDVYSIQPLPSSDNLGLSLPWQRRQASSCLQKILFLVAAPSRTPHHSRISLRSAKLCAP